MKKSTKDLIKAILLIPVVLVSPLIIFISMLTILFGAGFVAREVRHCVIRSEVFEYVEQNKDTIEPDNPQYTQYFEYTEWGLVDAGVIYGYVYSPDDRYENCGEEYRKGYRVDGPTTYGDGWFYYEEIFDNWYYYEEHYG